MCFGRGRCLAVLVAVLAAACATEPVVQLRPGAAVQATVEPAVPGNRVTILRDGAGTFQAMFAALAAARESINLEYYTFDDVHWQGQSIGELLTAKLAAGVAVNVIYDGFGSSGTDPAFLDRLRQAGARLAVFGPLGLPAVATLHNPIDRDHRKIMIIDRRTAFVGGVNLDRVYENPRLAGNGNDDPSAAYWRDTDARIDGPAVAALQRLFMATWQQVKGPPLPALDWTPPVGVQGDQAVRIIGSEPSEARPLYYAAQLEAVRGARRSISLSTGFFVPSHQEVEELERAARRGVRVRLILPAYSEFDDRAGRRAGGLRRPAPGRGGNRRASQRRAAQQGDGHRPGVDGDRLIQPRPPKRGVQQRGRRHRAGRRDRGRGGGAARRRCRAIAADHASGVAEPAVQRTPPGVLRPFPGMVALASIQAARRSPKRAHTAVSAATRCSMSASLCSGDGVNRSRSVPRGTVG